METIDFKPGIDVRRLEIKDYVQVCEWWRKHGAPILPLGMLSETGFISGDSEGDYAACWFYRVSHSLAWVEWMVVNPLANPRKRREGVLKLLEVVKDFAAQQGVAVFGSLRSTGLIRLYEKIGFKVTEENMTHLVLEP